VTTAERWARAKALFAEASMRPADERDAFVHRACAQDIALRDEVLSLLRAAEGTDSLPIARASIAAAARAVDVPRVIGAHTGFTDRDASLRAALETALGHQYEIVRPLGHGGMGTVYLARERALERFVAIKVLRPELADAQQGRERFRREARVAAQLSHPGILPLHTFGEVGGVWYFVMGYVRGATLAERLRVERRLPRADAQRILAELVDAWLYGEGIEELDDFERRVRSVSAASMQDVARRYFDEARIVEGIVRGEARRASPSEGRETSAGRAT